MRQKHTPLEQIVPMRTVLKDKQVFPICLLYGSEKDFRHFGDQEALKDIWNTGPNFSNLPSGCLAIFT